MLRRDRIARPFLAVLLQPALLASCCNRLVVRLVLAATLVPLKLTIRRPGACRRAMGSRSRAWKSGDDGEARASDRRRTISQSQPGLSRPRGSTVLEELS